MFNSSEAKKGLSAGRWESPIDWLLTLMRKRVALRSQFGYNIRKHRPWEPAAAYIFWILLAHQWNQVYKPPGLNEIKITNDRCRKSLRLLQCRTLSLCSYLINICQASLFSSRLSLLSLLFLIESYLIDQELITKAKKLPAAVT